MPNLSLPDTTLHYEDVGAGEPLVLLHGGLGTARLHWHRDIPFFSGQYRVIAPDLRGYGASSPPRQFPPGFYERDAADVAALLGALDVGPAHLLGWSDGAIAALIVAVRYPELVRSLVIVGGQSRMVPQERENWPRIVDTSAWSARAVERFKEAQGPENYPGIFQRMLDGYNAVLDAGGEIIHGELSRIDAPMLIIHGEDDDVVPNEHAWELSMRVPHAELRVWHDVGHAPHRTREAEFREVTLDFLRRASDPDRPPWHPARPDESE